LSLSFERTALLGAIAGLTIYLGLPLGRARLVSTRARVALAMFAVGILAFIFVDVIEQAHAIIDEALVGYKNGSQSFAHLVGLVVLLVCGFALGSAGLAFVERRLRPAAKPLPTIAGAATVGAFTVDEHARVLDEAATARASALRTGLVIAVAIGLHNFAEGLAIGVSARAGAIGLATVLVVGFALHNATEGFGIVGPLGAIQPSWRWLGAAGLIGGGPTVIGAVIGYQVTSRPLELAFYALAAGAIVYVIIEITHGMRRYGHRELGLLCLTLGFAAGIVTDLVVTYGGG
jgi:ZIP family zinc transporter